ncbi:hypothetical protein Tco_0577637 [Tanacetum coccineum]
MEKEVSRMAPRPLIDTMLLVATNQMLVKNMRLWLPYQPAFKNHLQYYTHHLLSSIFLHIHLSCIIPSSTLSETALEPFEHTFEESSPVPPPLLTPQRTGPMD